MLKETKLSKEQARVTEILENDPDPLTELAMRAIQCTLDYTLEISTQRPVDYMLDLVETEKGSFGN